MAMNGRFYSVSFAGVTLNAPQDLFGIYAGANKIVGIHAITLGQVTGVVVGAFRLRLRLVTPAVTPGTGGAVATPRPADPLDQAAAFTARTNDTGQATSATAITDFWPDVWNSIQGYYWQPAVAGRPFVVPQNNVGVLSLDGTPASFVANGSMLVEELP